MPFYWNRCVRSMRLHSQVVCVLALVSGLLSAETSMASEQLRVLRLTEQGANHAHRDLNAETRILNQFAASQGLTIEWIEAVQPVQLQGRLRRGEGDLIVSDLPPSARLSDAIVRGPSMGLYDQVVFGRHDMTLDNPLAFKGLRIAVNLASPMWPYLERLQRQLNDFELVVLPPHRDRDWTLARVGGPEFDAAVVAVAQHEDLDRDFSRIRRMFNLVAGEQANWFINAENRSLQKQLESHLKRYLATIAVPVVDFGDMKEIKERHVIRIITQADPQNYFLRKGRPAGFELELVEQFARQHGLSTEILVANSSQQAVAWLNAGFADMISARIDRRHVRGDPGLRQSRIYFHSDSVLVRNRGFEISSPDVSRGRVAVIGTTVEQRQLERIVPHRERTEAVVLSPGTPLSYIKTLLTHGGVDAALVDAHSLPDLLDYPDPLLAGASLDNAHPYAWTLRTTSEQLLNATNRFLESNYRSETYNVLVERYFEHHKIAPYFGRQRLSPFDELVQPVADRFDFDWRLIVAQMYQESRFNPQAESSAGALGLMQLLPSTATEVGIEDPLDPASGIEGGVAYLDQMRRRFEDEMSQREKTWFALAAYNVGYTRIAKARATARQRGLNPNRWFGQVERVMQDMAANDHSCRCGQTVVYVRGIRSLYDTYNQLHRSVTAFDAGNPVDSPI